MTLPHIEDAKNPLHQLARIFEPCVAKIQDLQNQVRYT
jgi:hypothetical protein